MFGENMNTLSMAAKGKKSLIYEEGLQVSKTQLSREMGDPRAAQRSCQAQQTESRVPCRLFSRLTANADAQ